MLATVSDGTALSTSKSLRAPDGDLHICRLCLGCNDLLLCSSERLECLLLLVVLHLLLLTADLSRSSSVMSLMTSALVVNVDGLHLDTAHPYHVHISA
jgi:hypothetical protein